MTKRSFWACDALRPLGQRFLQSRTGWYEASVTRPGLPFDLGHLTELLLGYQRFATGWRGAQGGLAGPGSILEGQLHEEAQLACEWDPSPIARAVFIGSLQLLAAEQHLVAMALALGTTDVTWPVVTLLRAVLEGSARAWRLLDPTLDAKTRVARALTEELYSRHESKKLPMGLRPNVDLAEIERSAATVGLTWLPGNPPSVGERRPVSTDLTATFIEAIGGHEGALRYRWSSGVAHGTLHGLMTHVRSEGDGSHTPELHPKVVASCLVDAALSFGHAFEALVLLSTGDVRQWHSWHSRCLSAFSMAFRSVSEPRQPGGGS